MASDTRTAAAAPKEAETMKEYDSDLDDVKRYLVMRRREASDEEEDERDSELPIAQSVHIPAGEAEAVNAYESDPDEVSHSLVMRRRETSGAPAEYDDDEEDEDEEVYEEGKRNDGAVKVKGIYTEEGIEEKKESNEPFAQQLRLFIWTMLQDKDSAEGCKSIPVAILTKPEIDHKVLTMDPPICRTSSFSSSSSREDYTQHKYQSKRDETLLLQTDLSKANTVIPKPIQWKDVNLPEEWILEGAAPPAIPKQLEPNTELQNVTQYSDDIPSTSIRSVDYTTSVPHPIYTSNQHVQSQEEKEPSPPTSLTERTIESEHPPLRSVTVDHGEPPVQIRASPYKIPKPNDSEANLSSIIQQNNFCNTNLNTIGKQLTRIENQIQKSTITVPSIYPIPTKSDSDKKLKEPIFKPFQVSKTSQKLVQESKSDFAKAIREQLDRIEAASSSSSKVQIAPDTPQSSKIGVLEQDQMSIASSDIEAFKEEPSTPKANKIHWELALPTVKTPPDLSIDNRPSALNQSRYNASSVYEWNIDGMSEYNILGLLQQMTMAANAYKTQAGTSDRAISEILIAGFTGQLKGWWDHLLTNQQQLDILNSIQVDENGVPILDEFNNPIQDAVATLILTISLHFIGDPSHLRDKNAELLHNLRCRKLSEFQSYKTSFFTRLFLRDDANHITWKEKFLAGLPTLLEESATEDFDLEARSCSMALKYSSSVLALANRDWALDFWVRKVCWALEASRVGSLKDDLGLMGMKSEVPHPDPW
ncbi:hypothetical protein KPL70_014561 [Citrus sinensis]|nr:hypothetical protein KPL70_014561 [Citrus sinensis]